MRWGCSPSRVLRITEVVRAAALASGQTGAGWSSAGRSQERSHLGAETVQSNPRRVRAPGGRGVLRAFCGSVSRNPQRR